MDWVGPGGLQATLGQLRGFAPITPATGAGASFWLELHAKVRERWRDCDVSLRRANLAVGSLARFLTPRTHSPPSTFRPQIEQDEEGGPGAGKAARLRALLPPVNIREPDAVVRVSFCVFLGCC